MTGDSLKKEYQIIWNEFSKTDINKGTEKSEDYLLDRGFTFQFDENIKNVDVLFIGINPSYDRRFQESGFYNNKQSLSHKYFRSFENIEKELKDKYERNIVWTHT